MGGKLTYRSRCPGPNQTSSVDRHYRGSISSAQRNAWEVSMNTGVGIAIGIGVGLALGVAMHNLGVGIALGVALSVAFGVIRAKRPRA